MPVKSVWKCHCRSYNTGVLTVLEIVSSISAMPGAVPVALLLVVATLQLQTAYGRSPWTEADKPARVQAMTATSLVQAVEQYIKNGLNTLQGSMCDHLQTVLSKWSSSGQLHLSTTGPPHADNSLLSMDESYWSSRSASVQTTAIQADIYSKPPTIVRPSYPVNSNIHDGSQLHYGHQAVGEAPHGQTMYEHSNSYWRSEAGVSMSQKAPHGQTVYEHSNSYWRSEAGVSMSQNRVLYATVDNGKTLSITNILFPGQTSNLPHNNLLNITFNCATGQLDVHARVSGDVEIISQVLNLRNPTLSIRMAVQSQTKLQTMILSTSTQAFSLQTFVAVRYDTEIFTFRMKGIPTDASSISQIPNLRSSLNSLPKAIAHLLNSKVKDFNDNLQTKQLVLHTTLPHIILIPNVMKLVGVTINVDAITGQSPAIKHITLSGAWKLGAVSLNTKVAYNGAKKLIHVTSRPGSSSSLNIQPLMKNIAGVSHSLPSQLTALSLSNVMGNIFNNGRYFVAIAGTISGGKLYLLFYKGSSGVKVGIAASVDNFRLSDLVKSATGVDITSVPYFGSLVVPAMAIAITSGTVQSPTLPHLFGKASPLLSYNDTLPAGITSDFHLDIGSAKGAIANFVHGVITIKFSKTTDMNVQSLASHFPGVSDAIRALPSQITSILNARVASFSFKTTSRDLSINASLSHLTLVSGFLSLSNVHISYDAVLEKKVTTRSLDFIGTWQIGDYSIQTSITYDGVEKQLTISSQSQGGKQLSIENVLESLAGTTVPLPPIISSFIFTGLSGKMAQGTIVTVLSGRVGKGRVSLVFERSSSSAGAVVADISNFKLVELVQSATGIDISRIPFFGPMVIPELNFAVATSSITSSLLAEVAEGGSPLEGYKSGILKGVSGRFAIQIGEISGIAAEFVQKKLSFTIPDTSSLSLNTVLSTMPSVKDIIQSLPSPLSSILSAKVVTFSYDPTAKELYFSGSIEKEVNIIPQFASLHNVKISLEIAFEHPILVKVLDITGDWILEKLPIHTTVSYNREEERLDMTGELNTGNDGINIRELVTSLSGQDLPIPSVLSLVTLTKLSGNKIGDVTLVTLSGTVGQGNIYLIYQKSPSGSAIAFAADTPKFRFSSLVASATGIDISDFPYFGTMIIPRIGFTISSNHINNPILSGVYSSSSPLSKFGNVISKGVTATFGVNFKNIQRIIADFKRGELKLNVPDSVNLSLSNILKLIPGVQQVINNLPLTLRDIISARISSIIFSASTRELQFSGILTSLTIVPDFLTLRNIVFELSGVVGANSSVKFANFKGDWVINSLELTTEITYENMLLINGFPKSQKALNITSFIKDFTGTELNIPSVLSVLMFKQVVGKVQDGTISVVFLGQIRTQDKVAIVYQRSGKKSVVAFAADVSDFQLTELVKAGTGMDITSVPFFGQFTIPALSFVLSSMKFSTALLPDLNMPGVPRELLQDSIPEGAKGHFLADIGVANGIVVDYSRNILTLEVPSSVAFSLQDLLSVIPEIKRTIDTLPSTVKDILGAKITHLVFKPIKKDLFLSLSLETLMLVPKIISMKNVKVSFGVSMTSGRIKPIEAQLAFTSPYVTPVQLHSPAISASRQVAEVQAMNIQFLQMKGTWVIRGIKTFTVVNYDKDTKHVDIEGAPTGSNEENVYDLLQVFSSDELSVFSDIISVKVRKVVARFDAKSVIVILSANAGSADVHLVSQTSASGSAVAIVAELEETRLADVIETASCNDVSEVPFIGSFVISTLAYSVSTKLISSSLLTTTFGPDSPFQTYGATIPKGATAMFKTEIGGAEGIEVKYIQSLLDFKVPSNVDLSLRQLLSEIPSINSEVKALPSPLRDLLACNVVAIRFNPRTTTLSVAAKFAQITIIPNILLLKNLDISLVAILSSSGGLQSLNFNADWILPSTSIRFKVSYNGETKKILFTAIPKEGLNIRNLIYTLTGKSLPMPSVINSVSVSKIVGQKSADIFTFIFSGSIASKAGVHLVYQQFGTTSHITITAGINSFKLADLVKSAVNIDISGIPFFGTFSVPSVGLTISSEKLVTPLLSQVLPQNSPLAIFGDTLPKGFTAKFNTQIHNIQGVYGSYAEKILSFTVPPNVDASLRNLLAVLPGVNIALPSALGDVSKARLSRFAFDVQRQEMSIEIFMKKINFFENMLIMSNTQLKLKAKLSTPMSFSAEAKGTITLGNTDFAIKLRRDSRTSNYIISVETEKLSIYDIVTQVGAKLLPDDLSKILGQAFNFNILNAKVMHPLGVQPQQIVLSGTPEIFGMKTVHMTAVAIMYGGKIRLVQKYNFGTFNLADFIKKLLGVSLHKLKILNQNVDIAFMVSPSTLKGISLSIPEFKGFSIDRGISFNIPLGWPSDCESDAFCAVAKKLLGGAKLSLHATIANARSFSMTASIGNMNLGGGVVLQHAGLQIVSGSNPSIGVVGSITMKDPAITLTAAIRATAGGVKLEGSMSGCWNNAFGSPYLTVCNLLLAMSIVPTPAPISGLEIGGRIEVGKKSCGRVLTAEGYIGINAINPTENYLYADIGPVTFQTFFDTFCLSVQLPRPLAESGFPKGFTTSFSLLGKELPHARISIPPGYQFKGTLNILGLEAYAEIVIQLPTKISLKAALPPLRIANIFKMYASRTNRSRGPFLIADISTAKPPSIEANGFVEVLGISAETKLLITTSKYEFSINGNLLNLYAVHLSISASYGSFSKANFVVEGWFKNDLFDKIAAIIRGGLEKSADEANKHISSAENKIRDQKAKFYKANQDLQNAKRNLEDAKMSFNAAISKVERARHKINSICQIESCELVCAGCAKGWVCCARSWGKCVCTHPGWDSCCRRITGPACTARNAACYLLKKPLDIALTHAIKVVDKSKVIIDAAKGALSVAQGVVNAAKLSLDLAIGFLNGVKKTYCTGVNAMSALANFALTKIINVREVHFKAGLNVVNGGRFHCHIRGELMGENINLNLSFDVHNIMSIARALAERAFSGISKFIG